MSPGDRTGLPTMTATAPAGSTVPLRTSTVGEGDDAVTYDVRGDLRGATRPALFLLGSPMDAGAFAALAGQFGDRPVITYDPRGAGRNPTGTVPTTVEDHAADLLAVIEAVAAQGADPVDVLASSGGAVNVLRLVETHPHVVRRVVAHEPPTVALLPDRDRALAAVEDVRATYAAAGSGPAMAKFIALVVHDGEVPVDHADRPAPDPAAFGLGGDDDGDRTSPLMRNMPACNLYEPDVAALAALGDRLVVAVGEQSRDEVAARGARSVAAALGREVVTFPGDHAGFADGPHGRPGGPEAFAARLRELLDD